MNLTNDYKSVIEWFRQITQMQQSFSQNKNGYDRWFLLTEVIKD